MLVVCGGAGLPVGAWLDGLGASFGFSESMSIAGCQMLFDCWLGRLLPSSCMLSLLSLCESSSIGMVGGSVCSGSPACVIFVSELGLLLPCMSSLLAFCESSSIGMVGVSASLVSSSCFISASELGAFLSSNCWWMTLGCSHWVGVCSGVSLSGDRLRDGLRLARDCSGCTRACPSIDMVVGPAILISNLRFSGFDVAIFLLGPGITGSFCFSTGLC